jgi:alkylation response protein AidB-like acyl-CoA dehydrogenase
MNFEKTVVTYSAEMEAFRQEVRQWMDEVIPPGMEAPIDEEGYGLHPEENHPEERAFARKLRLWMGEKGWLFPTHPKEYGGGGLTAEHAAILREEWARKNPPRMFSVDNILLAALFVYGATRRVRLGKRKEQGCPGRR